MMIFWYQFKNVVSGKIYEFKPFETFLGDIGEHIFLGACEEDEYEIVDWTTEEHIWVTQ